MGISKDVTLPTKVVCNYHKIDSVPDIQWDSEGKGKVVLGISQYLSYEDKLDGASPVRKKHETFTLDEDLTGILRYILYKAIMPLSPDFAGNDKVEDGDFGNMLRLVHYLDPGEIAILSFALKDIMEATGINPENYSEWYERLKEDTLSTIG